MENESNETMKEDVNNIGDEGKLVNLSKASRALNISPDLERVAKYDEYPAKAKKEAQRHFGYFALFAVPTAILAVKGYVWWSVLPGVIALWNLVIGLVVRSTTPEKIYRSGLLSPAVIVNENPLQIAVMAEMQTGEDLPVCWGVKRFDVKELPMHTIAKGERVPCVVMFGGARGFAKVWSEMEPHPVCWATGDESVLEQAGQVIEEEEWRTLHLLADAAAQREDLDYTQKVAYFNEDLSPRIDLYEKPEEKA